MALFSYPKSEGLSPGWKQIKNGGTSFSELRRIFCILGFYDNVNCFMELLFDFSLVNVYRDFPPEQSLRVYFQPL